MRIIMQSTKGQNIDTGLKNQKFLTRKLNIIIIAVFCCVLWGSAYPVLKVSYHELGIGAADVNSKILLAGMRFFIAAILLLGFMFFGLRTKLKLPKRNLLEVFTLGVLQTTLQYFFFYNGLGNTTGINGSILGSMGTFFVVLLAHFIYRNDKISWNKTIGLITGFSGIIIMNWSNGGFGGTFTFQGEGYLILAALMGSIAVILVKRLTVKISPIMLTAFQMLMGSILLIIWGYLGLKGDFIVFTFKAWMLLFYSAFLSATAFSLWYSLLKYNKAGEISLYKFMIPVSGAFLSAIFISGEDLTLNVLWSLILVCIGIIAINVKPKAEIGRRLASTSQ
jgi:drug/metabolite transporter (DMT)-like permease